jgi:hypothetical protein
MKHTILSILLIGLLGVPAFAQEKFTIKLKKGAAGDIIQFTQTEIQTGKSTFTVMGMAQPKDIDKSVSMTYKEEIIEKEAGKKATKLKQTFQKAEMTVNGKKINPSFIGKEVLLDRTGANCRFTVNGVELTGDDLVFMKKQFKDTTNKDDGPGDELWLPTVPVAVGDTWKPDMAAIAKDASESEGVTIDAAKSTAVGKFLKAYKKDGKQFGVFEIEMKATVIKVGAGPMAIDLDPTSWAKMTMRWDCCIDGTLNTATKEMIAEKKMVGTQKGPNGAEIKFDINAKNKTTDIKEDLTGKK